MPEQTPITSEEIEHLAYEALSQLGWKADAKRLASRLARLHIGLPREDEFAVVCTWLGRCSLVHKLDQRQAPSCSHEEFQIPDLLAVFRSGERSIPVLVEVKSNISRSLSFKPDYYSRLKRYAETVRLPLLVAWKYHGIWMLFDINNMSLAKTNYNITFSKAMSESLLGILAGDFSYTVAKGVGIHISMKKEELLSESVDGESTEQDWRMIIDDTFHTDANGKTRRDLAPAIQSLLLAHDLESSEEHTDTHIFQHFTVGEDRNKFAHMALAGLLNWQTPAGATLDWRSVIAKPTPLEGIDDFANTVHEAMREQIVTHVFHIQPHTKPIFLDAP
jgi:Holliday junction resolvase